MDRIQVEGKNPMKLSDQQEVKMGGNSQLKDNFLVPPLHGDLLPGRRSWGGGKRVRTISTG